VLKGVRIDWPEGAGAETWPSRIPDLYAGEPVVVTASLERAQGRARVSAMRGAAPWEETFLLDQPAQASGLGVLWARDKVGSLEDAMREGASAEETQAKIIELALTHHLVTKYTSLVAIDRSPARPAHADLKTAALPVNLPEGWSHEAVFGPQQTDFALAGRLPQGATDSRFNLLAGALALVLAAFLFRQSRLVRRRSRQAAAAF
jgi:Ca-activated chloride channel family protein